MPWVWLAGVGTPVDGLQAYQLHQPADPLAVDLVSVISEPGSHPSGAVERCLQVLLVYEGHQLHVLGAGLGWQVVQRGAADTQQGALAHQRQLRFFSVNHGPAPGPAHNPKLRDKNPVPP